MSRERWVRDQYWSRYLAWRACGHNAGCGRVALDCGSETAELWRRSIRDDHDAGRGRNAFERGGMTVSFCRSSTRDDHLSLAAGGTVINADRERIITQLTYSDTQHENKT